MVLPIAIVGAGIGGLTLARCLSQRGVPAVIYEKAKQKPRHNYGIVLHNKGWSSLLDLFNRDDGAVRRVIAVNQTAEYVGAHESIRINRSQLEDLLSKDADVRWDSAVSGIRTSAAGSPIIELHDGTKTKHEIVIGADGVHSTVRSFVSRNAKPAVLPYVVFNGQRRLGKEAISGQVFDEVLLSTTGLRYHEGNTLLSITTNSVDDTKASLSYTFSRPAKQTDDPLHKPDRPNAGAQEIPEQLFEEISAFGSLPEPFNTVFDISSMKQDRMLHWLMRTTSVDSSALEEAAQRGLLLIGDAVHAEPILGGEGANTAIADAVAFADYIAMHGTNNRNGFYTQRYPNWMRSVEASDARLAHMHSEANTKL